MFRCLWQMFWDWLMAPTAFPRDHWDRRRVIVIWDEYSIDEDDLTNSESRAAKPEGDRLLPSS